MLKLSKKSEYALRALVRLQTGGTSALLSIQDLADHERIPKKFLEQVLLALKKAGIVQSTRGKAGGYTLLAAPNSVTLADVVTAVDGPLEPLPCLSATTAVKCPDCPDMENCWLRSVMAEMLTHARAALSRITLAEVSRVAAQSQRKGKGVLTYDI